MSIALETTGRTGGGLHLARAAHGAADALFGQRGCLFVFHRAASPERWRELPNREFYLDLAFLDRLLGYLKRTGWALVTLDQAVARSASPEPQGRFVNFSIDDCYRDTFEAVVPLFARHGAPLTLFVTTGIPDGTLPLWGAGLEDVLLHRDEVRLGGEIVKVKTASAKRTLFARLAAAWEGPRAGALYAGFCADNRADRDELHDKHAISWNMLERLSRNPLVEIGAHTVDHHHISALGPDDAYRELAGSRARLEERLGIPVRHFAFPYGRSSDCGARDVGLARQAGYVSVATTSRGFVRRAADPYVLPRNTINGAHKSLVMAEAHLSGVISLAARVLGRV